MKKLLYGILLGLAMLAVLVFPSCTVEDECKHETILTSVVPADCDHEGYTLHSCQDCEMEYKTDIQPAKGHTLTENTFAPTCLEEGYTRYSCACGYSYRGGFTPPTDHTFVSEVVKPTCTKQGYTTYTCECGYTYEANYVSPTGHTLKKTLQAPTCTAEGYTKYVCACGYSYFSDYVSPTGHNLTTTTTPASCTTEGYTKYACACGFFYLSDYKEPVGHSTTGQTTDPTCTEQGYTTYSCSECSYSYVSDYVKPKGHSFTTTVTRPTSSEKGYTVFDCACGYQYTGNYVFSSDIFEGAYVDGTEVLAHGVDISKWNGTVNWDELKAAGIDFVIIRAGYSGELDPNFETNYQAAKAAGLDVGCYYYIDVTDEAAATMTEQDFLDQALDNAKEFLRWIEGKQFEYPVYLDMEDPSFENLDSALLTDMCKIFIEEMQSNGYFCGLYINMNWLVYILNTQMITTYFDVWYARYYDNTDSWQAAWGDRMGMWQYSETGVIGTHTCKFDLNVAFKDYPTIIKELGYNGFDTNH